MDSWIMGKTEIFFEGASIFSSVFRKRDYSRTWELPPLCLYGVQMATRWCKRGRILLPGIGSRGWQIVQLGTLRFFRCGLSWRVTSLIRNCSCSRRFVNFDKSPGLCSAYPLSASISNLFSKVMSYKCKRKIGLSDYYNCGIFSDGSLLHVIYNALSPS